MPDNPREFTKLLLWVRERARTADGKSPTEEEARSLVVLIGGTPQYDDRGNWMATLKGKIWIIPRLP